MASSSKWIVCIPSSPESTTIESNQLLKINDLEFGKYDYQSKCIQKYNTIDNKWTEWIKLNDFDIGQFVSFALNQHKLYVHSNKKFIVINNKQNTHKMYNCNNAASTIIINNKLHIVGG
eukprot:2000_1